MLAVGDGAVRQSSFNDAAENIHQQDDDRDPEQRLQNRVESGPLLQFDGVDPATVDTDQFLMILAALVEFRHAALIFGKLLHGDQRRRRSFLGSAGGREICSIIGGLLRERLLF